MRVRWKEYFASLFHVNDELQQRVSKELSMGVAQVEKTVEITIEGVHRSIARLKNRKCQGM